MVLLFIIIFTIACSSTDPAIEKEKQKVSAKSVSAVEKNYRTSRKILGASATSFPTSTTNYRASAASY